MDREHFLDWFARNRAVSRSLFRMIPDASYHERPIPLRHPIVFYDGHFPAFNVNTLARKGHGRDGVSEELEILFERGIDPGSRDEAAAKSIVQWPSREEVEAYGNATDRLVTDLLANEPLHRDDRPAMQQGEAVWTILEHEVMHHETLLYIFHALDPRKKEMPEKRLDVAPRRSGATRIEIPAGRVTLGAARGTIPFGWDNEFESETVDVAGFTIDADDVTNAEYSRFVDAGGYGDPAYWSSAGWKWLRAHGVEHPHFWRRSGASWKWKTMRGEVDLPPDWPVWVTHAEAEAYAKWSGARLPSEAEYHRAAFGTPEGRERLHPWGDDEPDASRGNFGLQSWDPVPVGSFPAGASAWGVRDLVGNGWEWTSTPFAPLRGFRPMASYPQYSADFFDGAHFVLKGASPATPRELVRRSFRNWFRPTYPWVWAGFRCVT